MIDRPSPAVLAAGQNLQLDVETVRLLDAILGALLLKGPSVSQWLYNPGERDYGDIDLLIAPHRVEETGAILKRLDYKRRVDLPHQGLDKTDRPSYAFSWRSSSFLVEIHQTLIGVNVKPEDAWEELSERPDHIVVAGASVPVLRLPARTLHLALHAAQHGTVVEKPLGDLRRGLAQLDLQVWREAYELALRLDAAVAFTNGLLLLPEGEALLERLGIRATPSLDVALHAAHARSSARSLEWFRRLSPFQKVLWVARKLVPPPGFMRVWHPLARTGRPGLLLAYLYRPLWLVKELALGLSERRRLRRSLERRV